MGTLSKRPLKDFGLNLKDKADGVGTSSQRTTRPARRYRRPAKRRNEGRVDTQARAPQRALPSATWLALAAASLAGAIGLADREKEPRRDPRWTVRADVPAARCLQQARQALRQRPQPTLVSDALPARERGLRAASTATLVEPEPRCHPG